MINFRCFKEYMKPQINEDERRFVNFNIHQLSEVYHGNYLIKGCGRQQEYKELWHNGITFTLLSGTIYIGSDDCRVSMHEFVRSCL